MAILVHITDARNVRSIERGGIKVRRGTMGVYCLPSLPDFFRTHQWAHELRRCGAKRVLAVDFRLPSREPCLFGPYGNPQGLSRVTVGKAAGTMLRAKEPLGLELIVPRAITAREVLRVREIPQSVGWRISPALKGKKPCLCCYCVDSHTPGAARFRASLIRRMLKTLREGDESEIDEALFRLEEMVARFRADARKHDWKNAFALQHHPSPRIRQLAADLIQHLPRNKSALETLAASGIVPRGPGP